MWIRAGRRFRFLLCTALVSLVAGFAVTDDSVRPDTLRLKDAGKLEGHFVTREGSLTVFITLDAELRLPEQRVESVECTSEGESQVYMGRLLFKKNRWDEAEEWLRKAAEFDDWKKEAEKTLAKIEEAREQKKRAQIERKQNRLATLIFEGDYKEGLRAIEEWSGKSSEEDVWAGERGRIHMILARIAVDHLDFAGGDRHLEMAQRAGVSGPEWDHLRELVDSRRRSTYPRTYRQKTPETPLLRDTKLALVEKALGVLGRKVDRRLIKLAHEQASALGMDPLLVCAVIQAESGWNPRAKSPKGAMGLMQLMPMTARELGVRDPMNPTDNVRGGVLYLKGLLDLYDENLELALGAYNAGPARITKYKGLPPFKETKNYVKRVTELYQRMQAATSDVVSS